VYVTTNAPESANLSKEDQQVFEAARTAAASLAKTFELWMTIARAVELAKHRANKIGRRNSFERILDQQGLTGVLGNNWNSQKNTASKLLLILQRLSEVTAWRETLTSHQRITWSAPTTIYKHCPVFKSDQPERKDAAKSAGKAEMTLVDCIRGAIARLSELDNLPRDEWDAVGDALAELVNEYNERFKEARGTQENDAVVWHKRASNFPGYSMYFDDETGPDNSQYLITPVVTKTGRLSGYIVASGRWHENAKTLAQAQALAQEHAAQNPEAD
jgi:hypothetical protein